MLIFMSHWVIYVYKEIFSVKWNIFKLNMFTFKTHHKVFDLILCISEFRFCIFEGQPFELAVNM